MTDDLPRCVSREDLRATDGRRAAVLGTYRAVEVRKRRPGDPPPDDSTYETDDPSRGKRGAVLLDDGTRVYLEPTWAPESGRSDAERERFEGRRVRVVGTVHREPPEPPEPAAYIVAPCVSPVERVETVEQ